MLYKLSIEELRTICKNHIENLEKWARRLIHEELNQMFGNEYFDCKDKNGEFIIKKSIRNNTLVLLNNSPERFTRLVDTLFLDDIIYILCHPRLFNECFKEALSYSYPQGVEEVREFLNRIIPIRNALAHSNIISIRQAEQVICYVNDFIDGLKKYYINVGKEKMWNVPTIIRITDSLGRDLYNQIKLDRDVVLHVGDTYYIDVEVDPSFERGSYTIKWTVADSFVVDEFFNENRFIRKFSTSDINERFSITCEIVSSNDCHKMGDADDWFRTTLCILPD